MEKVGAWQNVAWMEGAPDEYYWYQKNAPKHAQGGDSKDRL